MNRLETLLQRMPAQFSREPDSNNYKLLSLIADGSNENRQVYETILKFWDVDNAYGVALDRLGKDEGIAREGMHDEEYRKMIKIQCILNMSDADIPTMNLIFDAYFGEDFIGLEEGWRILGEPATLLANLHQIPFNIPYNLIRRAKPAGVKMILGTKQKMDIGLFIGGAFPSYQRTHINAPTMEIPELQTVVSLGIVSLSYQKTELAAPQMVMPNFSLLRSFGGVFSIYKNTVIKQKGVV